MAHHVKIGQCRFLLGATVPCTWYYRLDMDMVRTSFRFCVEWYHFQTDPTKSTHVEAVEQGQIFEILAVFDPSDTLYMVL